MSMENLDGLDSLGDDSIYEILQSWNSFCARAEALIDGKGVFSAEQEFGAFVRVLCSHGLEGLVKEHFLRGLEAKFKENAVKFWLRFDDYCHSSMMEMDKSLIQESCHSLLCESLEEICLEKQLQEKCLFILTHALRSYEESASMGNQNLNLGKCVLYSQYQMMVSSVLLSTTARHFPGILHLYFKERLQEFSTTMSGESGDGHDFQGIAELRRSIGKVVRDLRSLGFTSLAEDSYGSAIFFVLKHKVHDLAGDDYRSPVLGSIKDWIEMVPLQFIHAIYSFLGDSFDCNSAESELRSPIASCSSSRFEGVNIMCEFNRWQQRLHYFAYETLQDLRIGKLFEIIVDYPDSSSALEDLKQCLEHTGQHSKLVDSFISSLKYRLLTAGASTNDILHQYVSTIKALQTIDPTGAFLEAVSEPISEYLRGRKDTIKCIVNMLTDGTGGNSNGPGNAGDSLLEELNRDVENQENADAGDDFTTDDRQSWMLAECWEPDPVKIHPFKISRDRRKLNILGMMVNIIGSKDQLVNEYRVMLAEKLLSKSDYEIDSEIRNLELLKIHFGESSMQRCEIMLNDLIESKRTNTNIKASMQSSRKVTEQQGVSMDQLDATIISSNFWPPILVESFNIPPAVDGLLSDYARRFHEVKAPRKLLWKKNLGAVKLELQFEDRTIQFTAAPVHAAIIMQFQEQATWTSKNLAAAIGIPVDLLNRRINFWISKGILSDMPGREHDDHVYSVVEDTNRNGVTSGASEEVLVADDEGERSVASVEEQLLQEMTVYEKFILGMLTNFGCMALDRIHNTLKMFCVAEPAYDKSLQQLQSFLSGLISEEKLEIRDGMYFLKK